jgi:hypothetical protein
MGFLATHGMAAEFGLRRRCDRWGVLEKGLVKATAPVLVENSLVIKMEEYMVKKIEISEKPPPSRDSRNIEDKKVLKRMPMEKLLHC